MVKIEIELGIFFLRYYNILLYGDYKYAKIKYFVSRCGRDIETGVGERKRERERDREGRETEWQECEKDRSERKGETGE